MGCSLELTSNCLCVSMLVMWSNIHPQTIMQVQQ
jgi:hypothetical protein